MPPFRDVPRDCLNTFELGIIPDQLNILADPKGVPASRSCQKFLIDSRFSLRDALVVERLDCIGMLRINQDGVVLAKQIFFFVPHGSQTGRIDVGEASGGVGPVD